MDFLNSCLDNSFMSIAVTWSLLNLPETESIQISRQPSITFLDKQGRIIASYGDIYGQTIQYKNLPENLINAVIITEDKRFFSHIGVDIKDFQSSLCQC